MVGWCFLFMLVIIVLGWRERKKNFRNYSELNSRLAQAEELLLEVCALVEERVVQEELPPLPDEPEELEIQQELETRQEPVGQEEPLKPQAPVEPEVPGKPEAVKTEEAHNQAGEAQKPPPTAVDQKEQPLLAGEQGEQPKPPVSSAKTPAKQGSKHTKGKKAKRAKEQKLPPWNQQIIELWQKGLSVQEIARQIEKGQGEVQLIIDLYCDERPQS
ncbi:MAG: hypothetical protein GX770_08485 [Firmicutes bacterium]|nr:hypothetical protein [Bacillota bacterium]